MANVKRALRITFRRRRFGLRKYVLLLAVLFMFEMFLIEGRGPRSGQNFVTFIDCPFCLKLFTFSMYLFMRKQFQWDASLFGRFLAFLGILGVLTQYVAVPILTECLGIRLDNVQGDTSG